MLECCLTKGRLAALPGVPASHVREVLTGTRDVNLDFAKRFLAKPGIPSYFILEATQ